MPAKPANRNAYLILANLSSRVLRLQDAISSANKEQVDHICKQASQAMQFLSAIEVGK